MVGFIGVIPWAEIGYGPGFRFGKHIYIGMCVKTEPAAIGGVYMEC
jgi:hypothetical protein